MLKLAAAARRCAAAIARLMAIVAGWAFVACALLMAADVVGRNIGIRTPGTVEISGYMLAFGLTWALADALVERFHVRIDVLISRLSPRARGPLHVFALTVLAVVAFCFADTAWDLVDESILFGATDNSILSIPLVIPQGLWFVGLLMFAVMAALMLIEAVLLLAAGRADELDRRLSSRGYVEEAEETLAALGR
jgi:TRAP-type C4-dicarboxylate transport system permease small subunit